MVHAMNWHLKLVLLCAQGWFQLSAVRRPVHGRARELCRVGSQSDVLLVSIRAVSQLQAWPAYAKSVPSLVCGEVLGLQLRKS